MPECSHMQWFALHVRSRHEKAVYAQLEAKQQESFLPLYSIKKKWADRNQVVSFPLFPGYVFSRFDPANKHRVMATSGVIDVVRFGPEPASIRDEEIEAIKKVVNSGLPAEPYSNLVKGQSVMVTAGPLNGLIGILANVRNSFRLVVSVELLCRSILVEIDRDQVIPCAAPKEPIRGVFASIS